MIFLFGQRTARISHFTDTEHLCYRCRAFDREISVYRPYFHFCLIPCFPTGPKIYELRCRSCGDQTRLDSVIRSYQVKFQPAFYLFSGPILAIIIAITWYFWHADQEKQTALFLFEPAIGDVYTLEEEGHDGTKYNFLRVSGIKRDTVFMLQNRLEYTGFVSDLADDDYFDSSDTLAFAKPKLTAMREDKNITRIQRNFSRTAGFNRVKPYTDSARSE